MATYPPNQTTPAKGSGNYLWNWLGSSLKKFGQAISPYITGGGGEGYKKYVALLTQTGINPPVVTVLENTLGSDIIWETPQVGEYYGAIPGGFDPDKTALFATPNAACGGNAYGVAMDICSGDPDQRVIALYLFNSSGGPSNTGAPLTIEIRVYL